MGIVLVTLGIILIILGGALWLVGRNPNLNWGQLPGDLVLRGEGFACFIPIVSSLLLSLVLTLVLNLILRALNK